MIKRFALWAILWALLIFGTATAQARNIYGYVFGIGTVNGAISTIRITDMTTGSVFYADGWKWNVLSPGGIRWYKNNLPADHGYAVDVNASFGYGTRWTAFYLPSGWGDFKAPDIRF